MNGDHPPIPSAIVMKEQLGTIAIDVSQMSDDEFELMQRGELGHNIKRRIRPNQDQKPVAGATRVMNHREE